MFEFHVVPGDVCDKILTEDIGAVGAIVAETYRAHERGESVNPDSYFLRFPDKPDARIIALPARLGGAVNKAGIKWISSFPANTHLGVPRASAVLVLNDYETGHPVALLESAGISAARTAASAALAAATLGGPGPLSCAFVGAGVIARTIADHLAVSGPKLDDVRVFDLDPASADNLVGHVADRIGLPASRATDLADALSADLVVLATTAATPYIGAETTFRPGQLILNISLRDLAPELLLAADNVVDDVEHCLKASTSPHLAEQLSGSRDFINGTIGAVLDGHVTLDPRRPTVYSPFGLGVLDIAVGTHVLDRALHNGDAVAIPNFFGSTQRW